MPSHLPDATKPSIHAQRFRTKLCDKFATTGSCPYVHRCMFAHGEAELRTVGQNVADGLVNETSIRKYKRAQYEARKRAARSKPAAAVVDVAPTCAVTAMAIQPSTVVARTSHPMPTTIVASSASLTGGGHGTPTRLLTGVPSAASLLARTPGDVADGSPSVYGAAEDAGALSESENANRRRPQSPPHTAVTGPRFRHDPYSVECTLRRLAPAPCAVSRRAPPNQRCSLLPAAVVSLRRAPSWSEASSD
jgi:hypothetical protein